MGLGGYDSYIISVDTEKFVGKWKYKSTKTSKFNKMNRKTTRKHKNHRIYINHLKILTVELKFDK